MAGDNLGNSGNRAALQEKAEAPSHLDLGCWEPGGLPPLLRGLLHMPGRVLRIQSWGRKAKSQKQLSLLEVCPLQSFLLVGCGEREPQLFPQGKGREPPSHFIDEGKGTPRR